MLAAPDAAVRLRCLRFRESCGCANRSVEHPLNDAGVGFLGVADLASFVDGLAGDADVGSGRRFCIGTLVPAPPLSLTARVRRIIFIGDPVMGQCESRGSFEPAVALLRWSAEQFFFPSNQGADSRKNLG